MVGRFLLLTHRIGVAIDVRVYDRCGHMVAFAEQWATLPTVNALGTNREHVYYSNPVTGVQRSMFYDQTRV